MDQKIIPEITDEKIAKGERFKKARKDEADIPGLDDWNVRWVGPDGYSGKAAKAVRNAFRDEQSRLMADAASTDGEHE